MATIKDLLIRIGVTDRGVARGVARVNRSLDSVAARVKGLERLGRVGVFAGLAGSAIQLGRAFGPAIVSLGHLATAVAPAAGAVLALPAAFAAAKLAVATFKVGMVGISAAMKAFASGDAKKIKAALNDLPPEARRVVVVMQQIKNSFVPIRRAVQEKMFAGLAAQMRSLAIKDLPIVRRGMVGVAGAMNGVAKEAFSAARSPVVSGAMATAFRLAASAVAPLGPIINRLIIALSHLLIIGAPLLRLLIDWAAELAFGAADWAASAKAADKMSRAADRAAGVLRRHGSASKQAHNTTTLLRQSWDQLAAIGKNVKDIITGVATAISNSTSPGQSLLFIVTKLTGQMAKWVNSAKGQDQLSKLFTSLQQTGSNLAQVLPQLGGVLTLLLSIINSLPTPVRNTLLQMVVWSSVLSRFSGPVGLATRGIGLLSKAFLGNGKSAGWATRAIAGVGKGVGKAASVAGTGAARIGKSLAGAASRAGTAAAKMAADVGKATARGVVSFGKLAGKAAWAALKVIASWTVMAAKALWNAARMAASWIIAMGPVGWIIAVVVALAALIILKWDTISKYTVKVWNAIWGFLSGIVRSIVGFIGDHWRTIVSIIGGPFGLVFALVTKYWTQIYSFVAGAVSKVIGAVYWLAGLPGKVGGWFYGMGVAAVKWIGQMLNRILEIPGRIGRVFSGAGKWLYTAGRNIIVGLWNGIASVLSWLWGKFSWITSMIPRVKGPMAVDRVLLKPSGMAIMKGLVDGITGGVPHLNTTLRGVTSNIASGLAPGDFAMAVPSGTATSYAAGGSSAAAGADHKALVAAFRAAIKDLRVDMDGKPVAKIVSGHLGRDTDQRRRTR